jgi:hypothetical protein
MNKLQVLPQPGDDIPSLRMKLARAEHNQMHLASLIIALLKEKHDGQAFIKLDTISSIDKGGYGLNYQALPELGTVKVAVMSREEMPVEKTLDQTASLQINEKRMIPREAPFTLQVLPPENGSFGISTSVLYADVTQRVMKQVGTSPKFGEYTADDTGLYTFSQDDAGFEVLLSYSYYPGKKQEEVHEKPTRCAKCGYAFGEHRADCEDK